MKLAILQFDPTQNSFEGNIAKAVKAINNIATTDLIVLPELWAVGFMNFDLFKTYAQTMDGPLVKTFQELARAKKTSIFMGSFVEESNGNYYNSAVYINKLGDIQCVYRKIHLFTYKSREAEILSPGEKTFVIQTEFGNIGFATCYDLRFPELFRTLQKNRAEIIIVPAAWPFKRVEHFRLFCQSRAVENLTYLISSNCCGGEDNKKLGGHSMVVDPFGEIIAEGNDHESVLYAEIDLSRINHWRSNFSALDDKKPSSFWNNQ